MRKKIMPGFILHIGHPCPGVENCRNHHDVKHLTFAASSLLGIVFRSTSVLKKFLQNSSPQGVSLENTVIFTGSFIPNREFHWNRQQIFATTLGANLQVPTSKKRDGGNGLTMVCPHRNESLVQHVIYIYIYMLV